MNRKQFIALFTLPFFTKIPKVCEGSPVAAAQKLPEVVKCTSQGLIPQIKDNPTYYNDKITAEDFARVAREYNTFHYDGYTYHFKKWPILD